MQQVYLHKNVYKLYQYGRTQESLDHYRKAYEGKVGLWKKLKDEGVNEKLIQEISGISRATYHRYLKRLKGLAQGILPPSKKPLKLNKPHWGEAEKQLVLSLRRENSTYGKAKIAVILKRDHNVSLSESTVGRILGFLKKKGLIQKSASAIRPKRKRNFTQGHARPWKYKKYEEMKMGERVQLDHMTVSKNGVRIKHFQAWDRKSKFIHAKLASDATSRAAKRFLLELIEKCPFPILSLQVDGGSEFRAHFEEACAELGIPLIVLPPAKPIYNGGVERGNRIFREEFYGKNSLLAESLGEFQFELKAALQKYNDYRPHAALGGLTPNAYICINAQEASSQSHFI